MILTARNLPLYLVDQGVLSMEALVDDQLTVIDVTRRTRNFKVLRRDAPGFFVKQAAPWDPQALETVRCEARCHWLARNVMEFQPLDPLLPPFHHFDVARSVLTVGLVQDAETLNQYHQRLQAFPLEIAVTLARALASYHQQPSGWLGTSQYQGVFARRLPWILSAAETGVIHPAYATPAGSELLRLAQQAGVDRPLRRLREQWQAETLIHGDLKWENCLVTFTDAGRRDERFPSLRVLDWEIADLGDAAWDVGSLFQAYLVFWAFSIPAQDGVPPAELIARAPWGVEWLHPAMRLLWSSYITTLGMSSNAALLERTLGYTAARLLQTACESLFMSQHVTPHAVLLLHLATTMLQSHANAVTTVFGQ